MQPAGAFFYDDELELEKEFMTVVNAINGWLWLDYGQRIPGKV